jgi:hypothetical protein
MSYAHTKTTRAVLISLVPVICPVYAVPYGEAIVDHMALTFGTIPAILQGAIGLGFAAYDLGALPKFFKRAQSLSPEKAERYFETWEHGFTPMHLQFSKMINQLMSMAAFEQPAVLERIGYRPAAWIKEVTHKRLTVFADDVKKQNEQILAPDPLRPVAKKKEVA